MCFIILHSYHLLHIGINIWVFFCKHNCIHSIIWYFCARNFDNLLLVNSYITHVLFNRFYLSYICKINRMLACEHDHILTSCRMKIIYKKMYWFFLTDKLDRSTFYDVCGSKYNIPLSERSFFFPWCGT